MKLYFPMKCTKGVLHQCRSWPRFSWTEIKSWTKFTLNYVAPSWTRIWAKSTASSILRSLDFRSCWMVFIHLIQGRPSGLLQFPAGEAVKICFASVSSGICAMCPMVRWQFRIEWRSTLEPLWCNAIYGWTRIKFRYDPGFKVERCWCNAP